MYTARFWLKAFWLKAHGCHRRPWSALLWIHDAALLPRFAMCLYRSIRFLVVRCRDVYTSKGTPSCWDDVSGVECFGGGSHR